MYRNDDDAKFGHVEFQGKDILTPAVQFDKLAVSGRAELLMISLIADTQRVKQIRAILCGGAKATVQASGIKTRRQSDEHWRASTPGRLYPTPDGYACYTHKLGYGLAHALFLTRQPGFMPVVTREALWQELTSTRYTTPMLKEWVPYIEERLRADELLSEAHAFNCQCGTLSALTKHLDEIVSEGLQQKEILIPIPAAG